MIPMIVLTPDMLIGMAVGFVIAMILFTGRTTLENFTRQSPLGCLGGIIFIGIVLLWVGGYLRIGG
jgi:hypothetical protein